MSQNFLALCRLPSEPNISTTAAPNSTRSRPLETRHSELSRNINVEEKGAWKGLQKAARRLDQKMRKRQNTPMRWQKWEAS